MELIINLLDLLTPYGVHSYLIMFAILVGCGFGFPMPEDVVLITGGLLASRGIVSVEMTFVVTMLGVLVGDGIVFFLGRKAGPNIKKTRIFKKVLSDDNDKKISRIFNQYGDKVIFIARFLPGLRMPIFLTTGIYKVKPWKFFALDGFAAIISVPVWIYVGFVFGKNLEVLQEKISQTTYGLYAVLSCIIVIGFVIWFVKKRIKIVRTNNI
ncbi:MAG: DedA family protein [Bdellovibrionota bacterium]